MSLLNSHIFKCLSHLSPLPHSYIAQPGNNFW